MAGQSRSNPYATLLTVASGELQGTTSATQLPNIPAKMVRIKAAWDNAGRIFLGGAAGTTLPDNVTDITTGFELNPRDDTGWLPIDNLNRLWRICQNAGDKATYMVIR